MLDLGIIILSYNTRDLLRNCLNSVLSSGGDFSFEICVVDNASDDGSADMVAAEFPQVRLVRSPVNGGFSYGNNLGLRFFGLDDVAQPPAERPSRSEGVPSCILLLNADTIVPDDTLAGLLSFMSEHDGVGVVGPKLLLMDGSLDLACRRSFPTPQISLWRMIGFSKLFPHSPRFGRYNMTFLDPDQTVEVDSVVGACMLVRSEAIAQVGLLDEAFFMYGEDLDWAKRIREAGWKVCYYPKVVVHHIKRAASRHSPRAQIEFNRAMRIFYDKHYADQTPWWFHWPVIAGIGMRDRIERFRQAVVRWRTGAASR